MIIYTATSIHIEPKVNVFTATCLSWGSRLLVTQISFTFLVQQLLLCIVNTQQMYPSKHGIHSFSVFSKHTTSFSSFSQVENVKAYNMYNSAHMLSQETVVTGKFTGETL